jgi:hypothetical protein
MRMLEENYTVTFHDAAPGLELFTARGFKGSAAWKFNRMAA